MNILKTLKEKLSPNQRQSEVSLMDEGSPTFSPPPQVQDTNLMEFGGAMKELATGKSIRRLGWDNSDYCFLKNGIAAIHKNGEDFETWRVNDGDILADDWFIL